MPFLPVLPHGASWRRQVKGTAGPKPPPATPTNQGTIHPPARGRERRAADLLEEDRKRYDSPVFLQAFGPLLLTPPVQVLPDRELHQKAQARRREIES